MKIISKKSSTQELEEIKQGDIIEDDTGKKGEVINIEVISRKNETQYYYKIKNEGTILIIK